MAIGCGEKKGKKPSQLLTTITRLTPLIIMYSTTKGMHYAGVKRHSAFVKEEFTLVYDLLLHSICHNSSLALQFNLFA